jgi:hypothetical protein
MTKRSVPIETLEPKEVARLLSTGKIILIDRAVI